MPGMEKNATITGILVSTLAISGSWRIEGEGAMDMKTSTYLFFLFLINILVGVSILQKGVNILLIQRALPFLPLWVFVLIGWGFVLAGVLCLLTRLIWSPFVQRFIPGTLIRAARIASLTISICVLCPWTMIAILEVALLHSAALGAIIYAAMIWTEARELKWPDLTPEMEHRVLAMFASGRRSRPLKEPT